METKYIQINDHIKLAYIEKYNELSKVGIILVHGLAEHKGRYEDFFNKIFSMNISVFAIDLRGHGESEGIRGYIDDFQTFLSDLDIFINAIKIKYPQLKLALLGHSLGGLISTAYVQTRDTVDFLVLSSPLLNAPNLTQLFRIIPYKLFGFIRIKKYHSESSEMLKYSYNDPLASNSFTLRLLGSIFEQGINFVTKRFKDVRLPILLLGGELDPLIKTSKFKSLLTRFASMEKKLIIYKNTKHRLLQSEKKDDVICDIIEWINSQTY